LFNTGTWNSSGSLSYEQLPQTAQEEEGGELELAQSSLIVSQKPAILGLPMVGSQNLSNGEEVYLKFDSDGEGKISPERTVPTFSLTLSKKASANKIPVIPKPSTGRSGGDKDSDRSNSKGGVTGALDSGALRNNTREKKQKPILAKKTKMVNIEEDDFFASAGISARPTFDNKEANRSSAMATAVEESGGEWGDDKELDDLLDFH
jgi:hypothetical protein